MILKTLGGLELTGSGFTRVKLLLLLSYLSLEGPQARSFLAELFWQDARDPMGSLRNAIAQLRGLGVVDSDETSVWSTINSDVWLFRQQLTLGNLPAALALYDGGFLTAVRPSGLSEELEEWVYQQREQLWLLAFRAYIRLLEQALAEAKSSAATELTDALIRVWQVGVLSVEDLETAYRLLARIDHPDTLVIARELMDLGVQAPVVTVRALPAAAQAPPKPWRPPLPVAVSAALGSILLMTLVLAFGWRVPQDVKLYQDLAWQEDFRLAVNFPGRTLHHLAVRQVGEGDSSRLLEAASRDGGLPFGAGYTWPVRVTWPVGSPWLDVPHWDAYAVPNGPTDACPEWRRTFEVSSLTYDVVNPYGNIGLVFAERFLRSTPARLLPLQGRGQVADLDRVINPSGIAGRGELNDAVQVVLLPHPSRGSVTVASEGGLQGRRCTLVIGEQVPEQREVMSVRR